MVSLLKTLGFFPELVITNANKGAAPIYAGGLKLLTGKALGSLSSVEVAADGGDGWYEQDNQVASEEMADFIKLMV